MKMKIDAIEKYLNTLFPNPKCELNYTKDYELLIATVLSAQATDKSVNKVTEVLFKKYDTLEKMKNADKENLKRIIKPIGTSNKKSEYIKQIASVLVEKYEGRVPNNRRALESMPGVGRKTTNLVLSNIYNVPAFAVDTHVNRVSKRLGLSKDIDDVLEVERKLKRKFKREEWGRRHHQLVLFGRYHCKAKNPDCMNCQLQEYCKYYKKITDINQ